MAKKHLVTTALLETWGNQESILYLGEWCKIYKDKKLWENLNHEVAEYHWDDRDKLQADFSYLNTFYDKLFPHLTEYLNKIHNTNFDVKYWKIVVGPWLKIFIQIIFDRWEQVNNTQKRFELLTTVVSSERVEEYVPLDMLQFANYFSNDSWNFVIYSYIIKKYTNIENIEFDFGNEKVHSAIVTKKNNYIRNVVVMLFSLFERNKDILIVDLPISPFNILKIFLKDGIFIRPGVNNIFCNSSFNTEMRFEVINYKYSNLYEKCVLELIPLQMPMIYIEDYKITRDFSYKIYDGMGKKAIISSYVFSNELLKFYAAKKVVEEGGTKFIVVQHGGSYGTAKFFVNEDHETEISESYLSWGWKTLEKNILPIGMLKKNSIKERRINDQKYLLLILGGIPRYSYKLCSEPIASQFISELTEQCIFINSLAENVRKYLLIKPYPVDFGWNIKERLADQIDSGSNFSKSNESFEKLVNKSRLVISTTNTTTFLETLSKNIPTVIFWNPQFWELRESAEYLFDKLKAVGIFHTNPILAAKHIREVWDDIDAWWFNDATQKVVREFSETYCKPENIAIKNFGKLINTLRNS
jgi:putative transferase (TIGR04331 family)